MFCFKGIILNCSHCVYYLSQQPEYMRMHCDKLYSQIWATETVVSVSVFYIVLPLYTVVTDGLAF